MPIVRLPETLVRRIAAGEVVERPASVLKELLENALDAGARHITVEWERAGRGKIRVTDDGRGIPAGEVALALERHATSKIAALEDLEKLGTFGFRGEALPSIAAVSRFRLVTRPADAAEGWSLECEGGKVLREGPCGAPPGTTVSVEDLFSYTPAREKFLKSDSTERGLLLRTVEDVALAARGVQFHVFSDGREVLTLRASPPAASPSDALRERLAGVWGAARTQGLKPVHQTGRFLTVWGWVSDVHAAESAARHQRLFVNNRPVLSRRLTHALYEAYRGSLMVGRHPAAVLFLDVNPSLVDVNVHPAKREVRLSHEQEAHGFLLQAVRAALAGEVRMPSALGATPEAPAPYTPPAAPHRPDRAPRQEIRAATMPLHESEKAPTITESRAAMSLQAPLLPTAPAADTDGATTQAPAARAPTAPADGEADFRDARPEPLAQIDGTYILARFDRALYIFDQHAAAERVLYEKLSDAAKNELPHRQVLLLPWVWELSAQAAAVVRDHLADFARLGYDLEEFGNQSFRVKAVPGVLDDSPKVRGLLEGLADDLLSEAIPREWDAILVRAACRGSVKAHDPLKLPEMERILKDLQRCRTPWSCPHGRPTHLRLTADDLAKRFKRV